MYTLTGLLFFLFLLNGERSGQAVCNAAVIEIPATRPPISHVARKRFDEESDDSRPEFVKGILCF